MNITQALERLQEMWDYCAEIDQKGFKRGPRVDELGQWSVALSVVEGFGEPIMTPHPGSPEASAMMDSVLAEYNYPSNMKNAARAGYVAATRLMAAQPAVAVPGGYTEDQIAQACMEAEISDGKLESLLIALLPAAPGKDA